MITKRQKEVLDFIKSFTKDKGYGPTYQDICNHLGIKAVSTAWQHVDSLKKRGLVANLKGFSRNVHLNFAMVAPEDKSAEVDKLIANSPNAIEMWQSVEEYRRTHGGQLPPINK